MARPKESERKDIKPMVLKKAQQLFLKYGYENITMRRIAKEVGVSPGAIYLYFTNRDEIMQSLCDEGFRMLLEEQKTAVAVPIADPLRRLAEMGRRYIRFGVEHRDYYEIMFLMPAPVAMYEKPEDPNSFGQQSLAALENLITECLETGYFRGFDRETVACSIWAMVHGLVSLMIRNQLPVPPEHFEAFAGASLEFFLTSFRK